MILHQINPFVNKLTQKTHYGFINISWPRPELVEEGHSSRRDDPTSPDGKGTGPGAPSPPPTLCRAVCVE